MNIQKIFAALGDELDRHYVAPNHPQRLYLSPEDYREFELAMKEFQEIVHAPYIYKTEGNYGEGWNSPKSEEMIHVSMCGYSWNIQKAEKSSLIWAVIKQ